MENPGTDEKITFCINTSRNEKAYIALLMESLLNGINVQKHNIMVFIDSDNQNTTEMMVELKPQFPNLTIIKNEGPPIGYAANTNWLFSNATTRIVSYLQSDNVVCLDYDKKILSDLTDYYILSSTRCEPPIHAPFDNVITYVRNFGLSPNEFKYEEFLQFSETNRNPHKLTNYFFAPFTVNKYLWNSMGGYDVRFLKSREDSDIALRFALKGYELKQTWDAIVYHFTCTSSRQWAIPENRNKNINAENDKIELERFVKKWGTFLHPTCSKEVIPLLKQLPNLRDKIVVTNPPIDETKLTFL